MYVIGTAGHVDHGKSTLVQALTGIDPDRLREEKAREMTIDLGFAWLQLPGIDGEVGVVDVPGHRDFIENMLAGVGGIDLALFVVAADEGIMPQSREHLAILDLLSIHAGIVVLTKVDMIDDPDWLELVTLEVGETLEGTQLEGAEVVPVSARNGDGIPELRKMLAQKLQAVPKRSDNGRPRLPVDRVFSLSGFGTVVTGTLTDGSIQIGDSIEIQPKGLTGRVRGLQSHKTKRENVVPGSRVAVNISGIDKREVTRGDVLTVPGVVRPTILIDALYHHLVDSEGPLKHNAEVKLFVGASEVLARTRVLGQPEILPGEKGWVQFALRDQVAVLRGDRFILRRPSPAATIGGGQILDPHPGRQHRRFRPEVIEKLRTLERGTPGDLLLQKLASIEPINLKKFKRQSGMDATDFDTAVSELREDNLAHILEGQLLSDRKLQQYRSEVNRLVDEFHQVTPLRLGMSLEEIRSRLRIPAALTGAIIERLDLVQEKGLVRRDSHSVDFTDEQRRKIERLMTQFQQAGVNSPSVKEAKAIVGEQVYFALIDLGRLITLTPEIVYETTLYDSLKDRIVAFIRQRGAVSAAEVRDLLQTSRKYVIALLENLDNTKVTRRVGDQRELIR